MSKLEILYSIIFYPQKYKKMEVEKTYTAENKIQIAFAHGAIAFIPIWPSELYRGAILPFFEVSGIEKTLLGSTWKERDPQATYKIILPTFETIQIIYNETSEMSRLTEMWPENLTIWKE